MAINSRKEFTTAPISISDEDYIALDLVLNTPLRLSEKEFNLGELISKIKGKVEFSKYPKEEEYSIDAGVISVDLEQLKEEYSKVCNKLDSNIQGAEREKYQILAGEMYKSINEAEKLLEKTIDGKIQKKVKIMGEFISSPDPKVVLYYNNINDGGLVPVFVHEMFHAWNYFEAEGEKKAVREIDEAMVEFATMYFLNTLAESLNESDMEAAELISKCANWQKESVREKKKAVGSIAAYGFGFYLYEKISKKAPLWIETYANKSASLDPDDFNVKEVKTSLAPFYPFNNEDKVLKQLEEVLFPSKATIAKNKLNVLYKEMEKLRREALSLEQQVNELEEDIIEEEIMPCIKKTIAPALKQMQRELVLVIDHIPGEPISVHISRKRNFIEQLTDTKKIVLDTEVTHTTRRRGHNRSLKVTFPDGTILPKHECSAVDTFRDVVLKIGVDKVRDVVDKYDLNRNRVRYISRDIADGYNQTDLGGGWLLMSHISTDEKKRFIERVSDLLGLGLMVEVV